MTPAARTPAARPPASAGRPPASAGGRGSLRFAAGLFVAGVLITGGVLALTGGTKSTSTPSPPARLPKLTQAFNDRALGVVGLTTPHWVVGGLGHILHLTSTDRTAIIAIGAPGPARTVHSALHVAIAAIRATYTMVTLKQAAGSRLGNLPASSVVMYGVNRGGARLRILLAATAGHKFAYLTQVFTAKNTPVNIIVEAQEILDTLRFTG